MLINSINRASWCDKCHVSHSARDIRDWFQWFIMAPTRFASKPIGIKENLNGIANHGITTRSKQLASLKTHKDGLKVPNKRKADSPLKDVTAKRAAFGDITNAFNKSSVVPDKDKVVVAKKVTVESKMLPTVKVITPFSYHKLWRVHLHSFSVNLVVNTITFATYVF